MPSELDSQDITVVMEVDEMDKLDARTLELQQSVGRLKNKMTECIKIKDEDCDIPCESISPTNETCSKKTQLKGSSDPLRIRKAVVVLTRLPDHKISPLRPPTPRQFYSEEESLSCSDMDKEWEPGDDSSDSDYRLSGNNKKPRKSRKSNTKTRPATQSSSTDKCKVIKPPVMISPPVTHQTKTHPNLPQEEVKVDLMVIAKKKFMKWQRGKIVDVITKEDGRLKYKVSFEERGGRSLVSGHHIAYDSTPKLEQLYVGARVVVRSQDDKLKFQPAILAELPNRKNRLRFLVFLDDHTPLYVGLPFLRLVCRPLKDALDDIPDNSHKLFLKKYLKCWPYFPSYQYWVGESLKAELNKVQQTCKVQVIDCSLMQVIFQDNQQEWLHRGSIRLDHMTSFFETHQLVEENVDGSD